MGDRRVGESKRKEQKLEELFLEKLPMTELETSKRDKKVIFN